PALFVMSAQPSQQRKVPYCMFLFSSRRRHTRSLRDWSSDVCSSDLRDLRRPQGQARELRDPARVPGLVVDGGHGPAQIDVLAARSEERRVGKERREHTVPDMTPRLSEISLVAIGMAARVG